CPTPALCARIVPGFLHGQNLSQASARRRPLCARIVGGQRNGDSPGRNRSRFTVSQGSAREKKSQRRAGDLTSCSQGGESTGRETGASGAFVDVASAPVAADTAEARTSSAAFLAESSAVSWFFSSVTGVDFVGFGSSNQATRQPKTMPQNGAVMP